MKDKKWAIKLFQDIQGGRGVRDFFGDFPYKGEFAEWTPDFSLGCEYGMLIMLRKIYDITNDDLLEKI